MRNLFWRCCCPEEEEPSGCGICSNPAPAGSPTCSTTLWNGIRLVDVPHPDSLDEVPFDPRGRIVGRFIPFPTTTYSFYYAVNTETNHGFALKIQLGEENFLRAVPFTAANYEVTWSEDGTESFAVLGGVVTGQIPLGGANPYVLVCLNFFHNVMDAFVDFIQGNLSQQGISLSNRAFNGSLGGGYIGYDADRTVNGNSIPFSPTIMGLTQYSRAEGEQVGEQNCPGCDEPLNPCFCCPDLPLDLYWLVDFGLITDGITTRCLQNWSGTLVFDTTSAACTWAYHPPDTPAPSTFWAPTQCVQQDLISHVPTTMSATLSITNPGSEDTCRMNLVVQITFGGAADPETQPEGDCGSPDGIVVHYQSPVKAIGELCEGSQTLTRIHDQESPFIYCNGWPSEVTVNANNP